MTKKQLPEDNYPAGHSKERPNREEADRSNYSEFVKDRRPRTRNVNVQKVERGPKPEGEPAAPRRDIHSEKSRFTPRGESPYEGNRREKYSEGSPRPYKPREERRDFNPSAPRKPYEPRKDYDPNAPRKPYEGGARRSFNPNFDKDNRPVGVMKPERKYGEGRDDERRGPSRGSKPYGAKGPKPYGSRDKKQFKGAHVEYTKDNYPRFEAAPSKGPVRLNRFIATSGVCSRREADELIAKGGVTVNGQVVTEMGYKVNMTDDVRLNGERLQGEKKVYILMSKPKGFVTTMEDPHAERTVIDLIKGQCQERVYPVGRLDKNSLGVLLITNDGDLTKRLTHPSYSKKKIYQVGLDKALTKADLEKIAAGIELEDGPIAADAIDWVSESKKEIGIEIHSGRNRIVRRIFESLGYQVFKLDRVYFAGLTKQRLKRGAWRFLTPKEVGILKSGEYE
ncbi:MAG: pseudouridine synthase [Rikenellaceae bacterium]|nr:pseudouridine synthase [Rikenellaceae bacterium]